MAEISRVIIPPNADIGDYDYLAFSFNGIFSQNDDFTIYRTSESNRYNIDLSPQPQDKTADNPGGDGQYFFGTNFKSKTFSISFAFDNLDDNSVRKMKQWLACKDIADLWFAEEPYKVYSAKITGNPSMKIMSFSTESGRVHKGEGTIQFICYWPYAHTPDEVGSYDKNGNWSGANGKKATSYNSFSGKNDWIGASGLTKDTGTCTGENPGDLPTHFVLSKTGQIAENSTFKVGDLVVTTKQATYNLKWDSKTGMVSGTLTNEATSTRKPIRYEGDSLGIIPVGGLNQRDLTLNGATLNYHYWYY